MAKDAELNAQQSVDDFFNDENKAPSSWFKFQAVGDAVKGTLVGKRVQPGSEGFKDQDVYELRRPDGSTVNVGFPTDRRYVADRMRNVKFGQLVGFKFIKEIPASKKGFHPAKSIEVYVGGMDSAYLVEQAAKNEEINFNE